MFYFVHRIQARRRKVTCTATEALVLRDGDVDGPEGHCVSKELRHYKSCMYAPERKGVSPESVFLKLGERMESFCTPVCSMRISKGGTSLIVWFEIENCAFSTWYGADSIVQTLQIGGRSHLDGSGRCSLSVTNRSIDGASIRTRVRTALRRLCVFGQEWWGRSTGGVEV